MRKGIFFCVIAMLLMTMSSCLGTKMVTKTPQEVKMMTTKQIEENKDLIFKSAISLLQSESYFVEDVNDKVGLIRASKRIENKNASAQMFFAGSALNAKTSKVSIYVEEFNEGLCEVKITLYEGVETTQSGYMGIQNKNNNESMIYDAEIYANWFNNLRAEIARRKALTK